MLQSKTIALIVQPVPEVKTLVLFCQKSNSLFHAVLKLPYINSLSVLLASHTETLVLYDVALEEELLSGICNDTESAQDPVYKSSFSDLTGFQIFQYSVSLSLGFL